MITGTEQLERFRMPTYDGNTALQQQHALSKHDCDIPCVIDDPITGIASPTLTFSPLNISNKSPPTSPPIFILSPLLRTGFFHTSPSTSASPAQLCSRLPGDSMRSLAAPADLADKDLSPVTVSHRFSMSSVSTSPSHQQLSVSRDGTENVNTQAYPTDTAPSASIPSITTSQSVSPPTLSLSLPDVFTYQRPVASDGNTGKLDKPIQDADTELPPGSTSQSSSASRAPTTSTSNAACAGATLSPQYLTRRIGDSTDQSYPPTSLALPTPPSLSQRQVVTYQGPSQLFNQAHNFIMKDTTFIENNNMGRDNFMKELLQETIIGAEFDSSARDPPPRCHPGTRLAIIQRCLDFITQCTGEEKLRWVVGAAGVGKSAVMQMVTESVPDDIVFASVFLSVNGRRDGSKIVLTIAYQLAVKCEAYRQFIRDQITFDPSLLKKSLSVQFNKFIVEPFMFGCLFEPSRQFLAVIDGLDECDEHATQRKLLELITDFCIAHPTSPIAWIIASRPEPHITLFFDKSQVKRAYTREEIEVDSDEACEEVQRYLRDELKKIKDEDPTLRHKREWPLELEFTKIASAAGGLFAYASTVVRYIGNSTNAGPAAQLRRVLELLDASAMNHVMGRDRPMDRLDELYKRILSNIPDHVMVNTRKLLLLHSYNRFTGLGFRTQCNALGLTEEDAYDAIRHLHAVMKIPEPHQADDQLSYYHKSFDDFLRDFERSAFSRNFTFEGHDLDNSTSLRIIEDLHDDGDAQSEDICVNSSGLLKGCCDNISLSWPTDERFRLTDNEIRITLYIHAMEQARIAFSSCDEFPRSISCFRVFTTRFAVTPPDFFFFGLPECAFDQFRDELTRLGKLRKVPLRTLDYAAVCGDVSLRFTSPTRNYIAVSEHWNTSCQHQVLRSLGLPHLEGWSTAFKMCHIALDAKDDEENTTSCFLVSAHQPSHGSQGSKPRPGWFAKLKRRFRGNSGTKNHEDTTIPQFHACTVQPSHKKWHENDRSRSWPNTCIHCTQRFAQHFMDHQDVLATVFVDGTQMSYVEVTFADPGDRVSEWRYRFFHSGRPRVDM